MCVCVCVCVCEKDGQLSELYSTLCSLLLLVLRLGIHRQGAVRRDVLRVYTHMCGLCVCVCVCVCVYVCLLGPLLLEAPDRFKHKAWFVCVCVCVCVYMYVSFVCIALWLQIDIKTKSGLCVCVCVCVCV